MCSEWWLTVLQSLWSTAAVLLQQCNNQQSNDLAHRGENWVIWDAGRLKNKKSKLKWNHSPQLDDCPLNPMRRHQSPPSRQSYSKTLMLLYYWEGREGCVWQNSHPTSEKAWRMCHHCRWWQYAATLHIVMSPDATSRIPDASLTNWLGFWQLAGQRECRNSPSWREIDMALCKRTCCCWRWCVRDPQGCCSHGNFRKWLFGRSPSGLHRQNVWNCWCCGCRWGSKWRLIGHGSDRFWPILLASHV